MRAATTPAPGRSRVAVSGCTLRAFRGVIPMLLPCPHPGVALSRRGTHLGVCPPPRPPLSARLPLTCIHRAASKRARSCRVVRPEGHAGSHAAPPHVTEPCSCPEPPARTAASYPTDWPRCPPTPSYKTTQISVWGALEAPCAAGLRHGADRAAPGGCRAAAPFAWSLPLVGAASPAAPRPLHLGRGFFSLFPSSCPLQLPLVLAQPRAPPPRAAAAPPRAAGAEPLRPVAAALRPAPWRLHPRAEGRLRGRRQHRLTAPGTQRDLRGDGEGPLIGERSDSTEGTASNCKRAGLPRIQEELFTVRKLLRLLREAVATPSLEVVNGALSSLI